MKEQARVKLYTLTDQKFNDAVLHDCNALDTRRRPQTQSALPNFREQCFFEVVIRFGFFFFYYSVDLTEAAVVYVHSGLACYVLL